MIINENTVNELIGGDDERPVEFHFGTYTEMDCDNYGHSYVVGFAVLDKAVVGGTVMTPSETVALFGADVIAKLTDYAADRAASEA